MEIVIEYKRSILEYGFVSGNPGIRIHHYLGFATWPWASHTFLSLPLQNEVLISFTRFFFVSHTVYGFTRTDLTMLASEFAN